jgi:hypothetical protein
LAAFAFNGVLDPGEDFNSSSKLEPGNVVIVSPGRVKTDATGRATVSLFYAESYALWVEVKLKARAVVSGTESSKEAVFFLPAAAEVLANSTSTPAGVTSPFGVVPDCSSPF